MNQQSAAKTFRDLVVWQKAHQFVLATYKFSASFPREELYELTARLRRAAVSIAANIAEGFRKQGKADKARFMNTAEGSVEKCRYYLILVQDLDYWQTSALMNSLGEVNRLLNSDSKAILASGS